LHKDHSEGWPFPPKGRRELRARPEKGVLRMIDGGERDVFFIREFRRKNDVISWEKEGETALVTSFAVKKYRLRKKKGIKSFQVPTQKSKKWPSEEKGKLGARGTSRGDGRIDHLVEC